MGQPVGLDFNAVMAIGAALDADLELLAETLPDFENALIAGLSDDGGDDAFDEESDPQ